jgi:hypothetical protein
MLQLIIGSVILSLLHALIPNHWLPIVAIARKEKWARSETLGVTLLAGLAHAASTIIIGFLLGLLGFTLSNEIGFFTSLVAPAILISLVLFFIWQHYRHHHFHLHKEVKTKNRTKGQIVILLTIAMFFSPCLEIEAYYPVAGAIGWYAVVIISLIYLLLSVGGMVIWVNWAYKKITHVNWHKIEHNAGIITGIVLILTGLMFFIID